MAFEQFTVRMYGIDELERRLRELDSKMQRTVLRKALKDITQPMLRAAKAAAPVWSPTGRAAIGGRSNQRIPGQLRANIRVLTSRIFKRSAGYVGVFFASGKRKGARYGRSGRNNPLDTYYWIYQEHPYGKYVVPGAKSKQYLVPAFESNEQRMLTDFRAKVGAEIEKQNARRK